MDAAVSTGIGLLVTDLTNATPIKQIGIVSVKINKPHYTAFQFFINWLLKNKVTNCFGCFEKLTTFTKTHSLWH